VNTSISGIPDALYNLLKGNDYQENRIPLTDNYVKGVNGVLDNYFMYVVVSKTVQ